jgi:hypothetical protein
LWVPAVIEEKQKKRREKGGQNVGLHNAQAA